MEGLHPACMSINALVLVGDFRTALLISLLSVVEMAHILQIMLFFLYVALTGGLIFL